MPRLRRDDGIELDWEERGSGPLVVIVPHWFGLPEVFEPLIADLARDHRVVRYDPRGTGESSRIGPHDIATMAGDLEALLDKLGGGATLMGMLDGSNVAIHLAVERPDLAPEVVSVASIPAGREEIEETDSMLGSQTVVDAFTEMFERDYRSAFRSVITFGNEQMTEDDIRERVARQVEYCPHEVAVERLRAYTGDDPHPHALALGQRLHLICSPDMAGAWFPPVDELQAVLERLAPEADVVRVDDGIVSRPDMTADVIRRASREATVSR